MGSPLPGFEGLLKQAAAARKIDAHPAFAVVDVSPTESQPGFEKKVAQSLRAGKMAAAIYPVQVSALRLAVAQRWHFALQKMAQQLAVLRQVRFERIEPQQRLRFGIASLKGDVPHYIDFANVELLAKCSKLAQNLRVSAHQI